MNSDSKPSGAEIRNAMSVDPEFLEFADALKKRYGAKMVYLKTPSLELGKRDWRPEAERQKRESRLRADLPYKRARRIAEAAI